MTTRKTFSETTEKMLGKTVSIQLIHGKTISYRAGREDGEK